jgi:hypothetical protein
VSLAAPAPRAVLRANLSRDDLLMRAGVDTAPLQRLTGAIDAPAMIAMNGEVELDGRSFAETAARFLAGRGKAGAASGPSSAAATSLAWRAASSAR